MGPEAHPQARTPPRVVARDDQPELAAAVAPSSTLIRGEPHLGAHTAAAFPEERSSARGDPAIPAPRTLRRRTPCPGPSASHPRPLRPRAPVTPTPRAGAVYQGDIALRRTRQGEAPTYARFQRAMARAAREIGSNVSLVHGASPG